MTLTQKLIAVSYSATFAFVLADWVHIRRTERAKQAKEEAAAALVEKRMMDRINQGEYDRSLRYLFTDIEFEIIASHYE